MNLFTFTVELIKLFTYTVALMKHFYIYSWINETIYIYREKHRNRQTNKCTRVYLIKI